MSCRAIKIDLYLDLSSLLSFLQAERVMRVYENCPYNHNLDLHIHFVNERANPCNEYIYQHHQQMSKELGVHTARLSLLPTDYAQIRSFFAAAQGKTDSTAIGLALLRHIWTQPTDTSHKDWLKDLAQQHQLNENFTTSQPAPAATLPNIELAPHHTKEQTRVEHATSPNFIPLMRAGQHVYLTGLCEEQDYRKALNTLYDIWVECGNPHTHYAYTVGKYGEGITPESDKK